MRQRFGIELVPEVRIVGEAMSRRAAQGEPGASAGSPSDRFGKVAVLLGGRSAEREVSLKSGGDGARGAPQRRASTRMRSTRATAGSKR